MIEMISVAREQHSAVRDAETAPALLRWYDRERRHLPWRYGPDQKAVPYRVWLSEIMLQQTTVKAVVPYYLRFLARWPTVGKLAAAELDEVLAVWAGLGYYSRARNLHACAQIVATKHRGRFPRTERGLLALPGIGPYTAAAIAAIAFGARTTPVDGNVERVVARLFAVRDPLPRAKTKLKELAATLTPDARAGDFAQAMMDLGADFHAQAADERRILRERNVQARAVNLSKLRCHVTLHFGRQRRRAFDAGGAPVNVQLQEPLEMRKDRDVAARFFLQQQPHDIACPLLVQKAVRKRTAEQLLGVASGLF